MRKIFLAGLYVFVSATASAQIPGQNINMVTGKVFPGGDPWLQKQNEPSGAVSTANPCRLLAGANDYRAVNVPGNVGDKEIGDAWVGWYTSINCGQTWYSTLMPGYPQDTSPAGMASPVKGLTTAADPTVRAGVGGFFAYSFIAFNRGSNVGKVAIARFLDRNTTEAVTTPEKAITYVDTKVWDTGSAGQYIDKPMVTVTQGTGTCTVAGKTIPASTVHLAWTVFVGNNDDIIRTKVYYARSSNCGATLDGPATKLSEGYAISQSASVAVAPNGAIYVVWRQFATPKGDINQILVAKSVDGGKSFTKGTPMPITPAFVPFDQGTTSKSFRTNAYPAAATDALGRLYVAVAARGFAGNPNQARVVVASTLDGIVWNMPQVVETNASSLSGHQIMPALTTVGGKLNLVWLDFRDDASHVYSAFDEFIREIYPLRHTMDVRGAQATPQATGNLNWTSYGILQDAEPVATAPRISKYLVGDYLDPNGDLQFKQLRFNRANLKLYAGGTRPFMGDFIDVAGLGHIPQHSSAQVWLPNDGSIPLTAAQTFYAFWTDNRDAKVGGALPEPGTATPEPVEAEGATLGYNPPVVFPGTCPNPALTKTRDANVYMSRIAPGLFVAAPTNSKPSIRTKTTAPDLRVQRAFPVLVENRTGALKTFTMTIVPPADFPAAGIATFQQVLPQNPLPATLPAPVLTLVVTIPPKSSITRSVFVVSSVKYPQIRVNVTENTATDPLTGSTILNADIENADIENADIENADIENQEVHNADIENADIENADIENADIENADIENADIENADIENADIENADIENADIENADIENADIENADIENADIENADIENGAVTDFSVTLNNEGNTTSGYQVKFAVGGNTAGYIYQLIGHRIYRTPSAVGCIQSEKAQNQILFNLTDPDVSPTPLPAPTSAAAGNASNATILVAPGEKLKVTLRVFDKDGVTILNPAKQGGGNGVVQPFCPIVDTTGANCPVVTNPITILVKAPANTNSDVPFEDILTTNPAGGVTVTTTTLPEGSASVPYSQQLQAVGGLGGYNWTVDSGALPPGLTLSPGGLLSGNPTTAGLFAFVVRASDGIQSDTQPLTLQVVTVIATPSVPGAIIGSLYGPKTLQQAGGTGPFTWTILSGSLPPGVTLNSTTGTLGGIATTVGTSSFVVRVQDSASNVATKAFSIRAMAIGSGDLIVGDGAVATTTGNLYSVSPAGAVQLVSSIGGRPQAIAQDGNSFIVIDRTNIRVLRVTPGNVETLHTGAPLQGPIAVAVTHAGDIVIGDNATDTLYKLSNGSMTTIGTLPSSPTELQNVDIVVEPLGGLMVSDDTAAGPVQLVRFSETGVQAPTVTVDVASAGAIAVHSSGDFLIADYFAGQIFRVTAAGGIVSSISVAGIGTITGMDIDFDESMYVSVLGGAVRHVPTGGGFTTIASGSPAPFASGILNDLVQFKPVNAFEFFIDGTPACASCPITNQFTPLGTTFSFVTLLPNTGVTNVQLLGPSGVDRVSDGNNHSVTAPAAPPPGGGFYNGTMTVTLPSGTTPTVVMMRLRGNDSVVFPFPVTAVDGNGAAIPAGNIQRRNVFTYSAGIFTAREETLVVTSPTGIGSVVIDMPVGLVFVDNVVRKP